MDPTILYDGEPLEPTDAAAGKSKPHPTPLGSRASTGGVPSDLSPHTVRTESPITAPVATNDADKRIGDFELLRVLGVGSFGRVFLAREMSLDRLVALKVSPERSRCSPGREALTLARLEHANIVQVFSETFDIDHGLRLLCMQYVPGATLERVLRKLKQAARDDWNGKAILDILDEASSDTVPLDPVGLRDREFLANCSFDDAVCWLGARVAEALAHAHAFGVRHRDVKPANVLLNRYGRPLLADFNVAIALRPDGTTESPLGGTLVYMAPEHLDAFARAGPVEAVDHRADIYSLGIVLYELLTAKSPFALPGRGSNAEMARTLAAERRQGPPSFPTEISISAALAATIRRCLDPDPEARFQSAESLGRALDGCRELRKAEKALPRAGLLTRLLERYPFGLGGLLVLLPHMLGSVVNVSYNALRIVGNLTQPQKAAFFRAVFWYNAIVYPACLFLMVSLLLRLRRERARLAEQGFANANDEAAARQRVLNLPVWTVLISCLGWLPGGILFPLAIGRFAAPVSRDEFTHFIVSFTISGLIALTYSFLAIQYLAIRVLYPLFWTNAHDMRAQARTELRRQQRRLAVAQVLAVLIPLTAAVMMVGIGPEDFSETGYRKFRILVTALIALGMAGFGVVMMISRLLSDALAALTGGTRG